MSEGGSVQPCVVARVGASSLPPSEATALLPATLRLPSCYEVGHKDRKTSKCPFQALCVRLQGNRQTVCRDIEGSVFIAPQRGLGVCGDPPWSEGTRWSGVEERCLLLEDAPTTNFICKRCKLVEEELRET